MSTEIRGKDTSGSLTDGLFPESAGTAFEPAGIVGQFQAAEEAEAEGEALEGNVHLIEGEEQPAALGRIGGAEGGFGLIGPVGEALINPAMRGEVKGSPDAIVGGDVAIAEEGAVHVGIGAGENGGDGTEGFFAIEILVELQGMAMRDGGGWFKKDVGFEGHQTEGEIEVFVAVGAEAGGETAEASEVGGADGDVEIPGVAIVV